MMIFFNLLLVAIVLLGQTLLLWGIFVLLAYLFRCFMQNRVRKHLKLQYRIVRWDSIKNSPDDGVVWLNRSKKYFYGLRLWWIPNSMTSGDSDLFVEWPSFALLIDDQNLDQSTFAASGHRIEDFDEW